MAPMYEQVCTSFGWPVDGELQARLKERNATDLAALTAKAADAKDKFGETEVFDAMKDVADYHARIGDKVSFDEREDELARATVV
jgi:hypothetical protein